MAFLHKLSCSEFRLGYLNCSKVTSDQQTWEQVKTNLNAHQLISPSRSQISISPSRSQKSIIILNNLGLSVLFMLQDGESASSTPQAGTGKLPVIAAKLIAAFKSGS